jgi:hypothetical protein
VVSARRRNLDLSGLLLYGVPLIDSVMTSAGCPHSVAQIGDRRHTLKQVQVSELRKLLIEITLEGWLSG